MGLPLNLAIGAYFFLTFGALVGSFGVWISISPFEDDATEVLGVALVLALFAVLMIPLVAALRWMEHLADPEKPKDD